MLGMTGAGGIGGSKRPPYGGARVRANVGIGPYGGHCGVSAAASGRPTVGAERKKASPGGEA